MTGTEAIADFNYPVRALAALERNPRGVTLRGLRRSVSNEELAKTIRAFATNMALRGINRNSVVVLALPEGPMAFAACLAVGLLGARWVAMNPALPFRQVGATHLLYGEGGRPANANMPASYEIDASWLTIPSGMPGASRPDFPGFSDPGDVAYLARSSGTTGTAKFITKTSGYVVSMADRHGPASNAVMSPLASTMSSMTHRNIVSAILEEGRVVLPSFQPRDTDRVAMLQRLGVEYVLGSPLQVDAICKGKPPARRIRRLRVAGAAMDVPGIRHWLRFFEEVVLTYGSREGGGGGTLALRAVDETTEIAYTPRPNCEVQVVSEDGQPLPHSVPGIFRMRSPSMVTGYVGAGEASAEVFRDGWFYPGDIAMMTEDGRFKIIGRLKDQLNVGGVKFNAATIDEAARSVEGVADAVCFLAPGTGGAARLAIAVVPSAPGDERALAAAIREACRKVIVSIDVHAIHFVPALPVPESGKHVRTTMASVTANSPAY